MLFTARRQMTLTTSNELFKQADGICWVYYKKFQTYSGDVWLIAKYPKVKNGQ